MADLESRVGKRWDLEVPIWHGSGKNLSSSKWLWDSFQLPQKSEHKQDEKKKKKPLSQIIHHIIYHQDNHNYT